MKLLNTGTSIGRLLRNIWRVLHGERPWTIEDYFADLAGQVASAYQKKQQRR